MRELKGSCDGASHQPLTDTLCLHRQAFTPLCSFLWLLAGESWHVDKARDLGCLKIPTALHIGTLNKSCLLEHLCVWVNNMQPSEAYMFQLSMILASSQTKHQLKFLLALCRHWNVHLKKCKQMTSFGICRTDRMADLLGSWLFLNAQAQPRAGMLCLKSVYPGWAAISKGLASGYMFLGSFYPVAKNGHKVLGTWHTEIRSLQRLFSSCLSQSLWILCASKWLTRLNDCEAFSGFNVSSLTSAPNPLSIRGISHWHFCRYLPSFWYHQVSGWIQISGHPHCRL